MTSPHDATTEVDVEVDLEPEARVLLRQLSTLEWWSEELGPQFQPASPADGLQSLVAPPRSRRPLGAAFVLGATAGAVTTRSRLAILPMRLLLPGIEKLGPQPPSAVFRGGRGPNLVRWNTGDSWSRIANVSADDMKRWQNAGTVVVRELIAGFIAEWVESLPKKIVEAHEDVGQGRAMSKAPGSQRDASEPPAPRILGWLKGPLGRRQIPMGSHDAGLVADIASEILERADVRRRRLAELLPGLEAVDGKPSAAAPSVRTQNLLRNWTRDTWRDVSALSAEQIASWKSAGTKSVLEITCTAVAAWMEHEAQPATSGDGDVGDGDLGDGAPHPGALGRAHSLLDELVELAVDRGGGTLGDLVAVVGSDRHAARLWSELLGLQLDCMTTDPDDVEGAWSHLLAFDPLDTALLRGRLFGQTERMRLSRVGTAFGLEPKRARQMERRVATEVEQRLSSEACVPVRRLVGRLRRILGALATEGEMDVALEALVSADAPDPELRRAALRWLAGPYEKRDGFWFAGPVLEALRLRLLERLDEPLTHYDLERVLSAADLREELRPLVVRALPLREFDDRHVVWVGSRADKVVRLLSIRRAPMTVDDLRRNLGSDGPNNHVIQEALGNDDRIVCLEGNTYGLSDWQHRGT